MLERRWVICQGRVYPQSVNGSLGAVIVVAIVGVAIGVLFTLAFSNRRSRANSGAGRRSARPVRMSREQGHVADGPASADRPIDVDEVARVLDVLPGASVLIDLRTRQLVMASVAAEALGLIKNDRIAFPELTEMIQLVAETDVVLAEEISIRRPPLAGGRLDIVARVSRIGNSAILVLIEDLTGARRVDEVRRDFVANVSHELKTPVGALALLAEAVLSAADDPEAVQHFAGRMQVESNRLANLVTDLVDLSRLQGENPMEYAERVSVDRVVSEAVDSMRMAAEADRIELVIGGASGLMVYGVEGQLITALRNLLSNAVGYSPPLTRVAIGKGITDGIVEITVTDQGIGIPAGEIDRIWERFYRVDQARSRVTGGTGLGLSIVKHVCRNHGGDVAVWSIEGEGSTFTLRLPAYRKGPSRGLKITAAAGEEGDVSK
jgi:two-component system, OmpR family, sensor histidine kinase SenX3